MTEPPVKDTLRACFRLVRAACVVRTLALVAIFMPMYPASAEKNAPIRNDTAIIGLEVGTNVPDQAKTIPAITAK